MSGMFTTSEFEYQISKLSFRGLSPESLKSTSTGKITMSEVRATVRVPEDKRAAQVTMQMPRHGIGFEATWYMHMLTLDSVL
jgi:hypothetical protein